LFKFSQAIFQNIFKGGNKKRKGKGGVVDPGWKMYQERRKSMEDHYPPSLKRISEETAFYLSKNSDQTQIFSLYKSILATQIAYLDKIHVSVTLPEEQLKNNFRNKKFVLSSQKLDIDNEIFKGVMSSICQAIKKESPMAPDPLLRLSLAEEFSKGNIDGFLNSIALLNKDELINFIETNEMDKRTGLDSEIIAFVIFMSLSPFYSALMKEVLKKTDFAIWRQGYCPICSQAATIAQHRKDDGARVLECWLCHARWIFPRMECPYCHNTDQKTLRFFYVSGDKARQVHVCEKCKKYLKTIDSKVLGRDVLLGVEAIGTAYLDQLAEKEGYRPPSRAAIDIKKGAR
jgi:FdhE protein